MQNILILGAGLMQKPAIEAVKRLGYRSVVADGNPDAVCVPLADRFEPIDLKDMEALLALARELQDGDGLKAVFTAGTDFSRSVAYVTEKLGLPGHSYEAACKASDKIAMRTAFRAASVPSPEFFGISGDDAKLDAVSIMALSGLREFPLVVKPCDNMGARGCRDILSIDELSPAVKDAVHYSRTGRAILEEHMDGAEFSIDALVFNGELTVTGFADRHIYYPPYFIEMGHTLPSAVSEADKTALFKTFFDGVKALGLTHGAAKADIKFTSNGPMIGEIAARLSGGYMSGWTYPYASGMNLTEQALLLALGEEPAELLEKRVPTAVPGVFEVPAESTSAERAWVSIPGTVASISGLKDAQAVPGVKNVLPRMQTGDPVRFPLNNVEKCGNIISLAPDRDSAVNAAGKAVSKIVLRLEPQNVDTDTFLGEDVSTAFPPSAYQLPNAVLADLDSLSESAEVSPASRLSIQMPVSLEPFVDTLTDWNHRTISDTLSLYCKLAPASARLPLKAFWHLLVRGGIQALLYAADSSEKAVQL